jgi:hypothetical protein
MSTKFNKFLDALFALSPTAIASYLSQWLGLFNNAGLAHRDFAPQTERLALGISTIAVLTLYVWLYGKSRKLLSWMFSIIFLVGFIGSIVGCLYLDYLLPSQKQVESIEMTINIWRWTYLSLLIFTSLTVVVFMLWLQSLKMSNENPNKSNSPDSQTRD